MITDGLAERSLGRLERAVGEARWSDYVMPVWLPFLDIILFLVLIPAIVFFAVIGLLAVSFTLLLLLAAPIVVDVYVVYRWVSRRNMHFERSQAMFRAALGVVEGLGLDARGASAVLKEMLLAERPSSPLFWVLVLLLTSPIPVLGFLLRIYFLHMLTRDFYLHSVREELLAEELDKVLPEPCPRPPHYLLRRLPDRNTVVYALLTIVTFGLFALYWVYAVTVDPNEHFQKHRLYDRRLLEALRETPSCVGAGS